MTRLNDSFDNDYLLFRSATSLLRRSTSDLSGSAESKLVLREDSSAILLRSVRFPGAIIRLVDRLDEDAGSVLLLPITFVSVHCIGPSERKSGNAAAP